MCWWTNALYDTCSLITLDKLFDGREAMAGHFTGILALDESFSADQMRADTATRMRSRVTACTLPSPSELAAILTPASLSRSLSQVDTLVFATAVHQGLTVVTADKRLAKAILAQRLQVGDIALVLRELVVKRKMAPKDCEAILVSLAAQSECLLGTPYPTWALLRNYRFPA